MNTPFPGYSEPHDTLTQDLDPVSVSSIKRMNATLIGVQYLVSSNDGRDLYGVPYAEDIDAVENVPFGFMNDGQPELLNHTNYAVDEASVQLIASGLEARVSGDTAMPANTDGSSLRLRFADPIFSTDPDTVLATALGDRPIQVGDVLRSTYSGGNVGAAVVTGYLAAATTPVVGSVVRGGSAPNTVTVAGTYTPGVDNTFVMTVEEVDGDDVTVSIYDTAGLYPRQVENFDKTTPSTSLDIGDTTGIAFACAAGAYVVGNSYTVSVVDAGFSTTDFDGVTLSAPLYDVSGSDATDLSIHVYQRFYGPLTADNSSDGASDPFSLVDLDDERFASYDPAGLGITPTETVGFCPFAEGIGTIKIAFRAAKKVSITDSVMRFGPSDDASELGEDHPDNDLRHGLTAMRAGAGDAPIYVVRISGDTVNDLQVGLRKIRSSDSYYAIALLSEDADVIKAFRADIVAQSSATVMRWRKGYVGVDSPGEYTLWGALPSGGYRRASLINNVLTVFEDDQAFGDFISAGVLPGDKIKFMHLSISYTVAGIEAGDDGESWQLRIEEDVEDIVSPSSFTIIKPASALNTAEFVKRFAGDVGGAVGDGRITLLWCDAPTSALSNGPLKSKYLAAMAAGWRAALLPQQGVATYEVPIITSAPSMYNEFEPDVLRDMAAAGVMVITQDSPDSPVYVYDQVTTCTTGGLLKFQDNCRSIVDSFSYAVKDGQQGLRGRKNASRITASQVENITLRTALDYSQVDLAEYNLAGPRILAFYNRDGVENKVTVERNPNLINRISTYITIDVPVPLNGIDTVVRAVVGTTF